MAFLPGYPIRKGGSLFPSPEAVSDPTCVGQAAAIPKPLIFLHEESRGISIKQQPPDCSKMQVFVLQQPHVQQKKDATFPKEVHENQTNFF